MSPAASQPGSACCPKGETLVATLTDLLSAVEPWRVTVNHRYFDWGFFRVPIIRWLKALNSPFLMPVVIRGTTGGPQALCQGRKRYRTIDTLNSPQHAP